VSLVLILALCGCARDIEEKAVKVSRQTDRDRQTGWQIETYRQAGREAEGAEGAVLITHVSLAHILAQCGCARDMQTA
jgi:hypothetical protein